MVYSYEGRDIWWESHGEGRPLLLLNGIMMTTASWAPFVKAFARDGIRLLLVDLIDQGRSSALLEEYTIARQAHMVQALLLHLGLAQVSVLGTSYGGTVALRLAIDNPDLVDRLLLAGTRAWCDPLFEGMCENWLHALHSPSAFYAATIPLFYGATFQQAHRDWMLSRRKLLERTVFSNQAFMARMGRLIRSLAGFDVREELCRIACPTLVISAQEDLVMMPWEQQRIGHGIPGAHMVTMHEVGHVMFLERPDVFVPIVMGWFAHRDQIALP